MIRLNLPNYATKLSGTTEHPLIWDTLRRRRVALTPEEWVRQHFVNYLIAYKHYPEGLLANEISLKVGQKDLRADTVLYDHMGKARMIIEYKAPHIAITQKVFDQIGIYNLLLHVDYLIVSNGLTHYVCKMDYEHQCYRFLSDIPNYEQLEQ